MSDYIPPELIPNILARLPVDDVLRCTSVCKSWYSFITCPSFASSHLNLSSPNHEPLVLVEYYKPEDPDVSYCLHRDNQTFDEIAKLVPPLNPDWERVIDSSNGLICLYDEGTVALWNPSLRKSLILPNSRVLSDSQVTYIHKIGFGFVATSNEYKILKLSYADNNTESQAEIYQLSTGSWRDVKFEDSLDIQLKYQQAHLNGILHWSACNPEKFNPNFANYICSFDLKNEKFGTLMLPSCLRHDDYDDDDDAYFIPSTFRESLCLIDETSNEFCKIWVMKEYGVSDSWQKLIVISTQLFDLPSLIYFRHNGEILGESSGNRKLVSYDCNNKRVKNIELLENCFVTSIHTYVESLALINSPNEVKIDEESTNVPENIQGFSDLMLNRMNETGEGSKLNDEYCKW